MAALPNTLHSVTDGDHHDHSHLVGAGETVVTMFTTMFNADPSSPKYWIQLNTVRALQLLPGVDVVVFSKDREVATAVAQHGEGAEVVADFETNKYGTPKLKSMFRHVEHHGNSQMFGYTNGDILFCDELVHTLKTVLAAVQSGQLTKRVLVVGKRYNYAMPERFSSSSPLYIKSAADVHRVIDVMRPATKPFQDDAQDFFIITPGTFVWDRIPDFVVGRPAYDNWLVDHAFHDGIDTVDVSKTVHAVHQTDGAGNKAGHIVRWCVVGLHGVGGRCSRPCFVFGCLCLVVWLQPRPDKDWNVKRGRNQYDHGFLSAALYETVDDGSTLRVGDRRHVKRMAKMWSVRDQLRRRQSRK